MIDTKTFTHFTYKSSFLKDCSSCIIWPSPKILVNCLEWECYFNLRSVDITWGTKNYEYRTLSLHY